MRKKIIFIVVGLTVLFFVGKTALKLAKFSPFLFQLIFNHGVNLKKSDDNINILLLGIGGGKHDGPNLTDTIIFASINQKKDKITLISIPRDLWIPDLNGKINTAYAIGEEKRKGGGLILAKTIVSKVINEPIDYAVRIDFSGFVKAVDLAGGLDINVQNSFDDYEYPITGKENDPCGHSEQELQALATASSQLAAFPCRYMHIHFDRGLQHMDGTRVLEFVRSRHAQGAEGTDFARSKRQEKVIKAFKDKFLSFGILLNPGKIISLYDTLSSSIDTDIKQDEFYDFIRLAQQMKNAKIESAVLDYGDKETGRPGLLVNPPTGSNYSYEWVLAPRIGNGNFSEIQKYVECEIKVGNCKISKNPSS